MAADNVGAEQQKREGEPCGTPAAAAALADSSVQFKIPQLPPEGAAKVVRAVEGQQPSAAAGSAPGLPAPPPSVMVIAKAAPPQGQAHIARALFSQVASIKQLAAASGRTVVIAVPRAAAPHTHALAAAPQLPPSAPPQPASLQIPAGER